MAAPDSVTLKDFSGMWLLNKSLSDPFDDVLALQGIGWLARKGIGFASITLHINQYTSADDGMEHIDIDQVATGGIKGTSEFRTYDDQWRKHQDHIFGLVRGRNRRSKLSGFDAADADEKYLMTGWSQDIVDADEVLDGTVESLTNGWTARLVWGFAVVDGVRRHVRRSIVKKGDATKRVTLVHDYVGPLPAKTGI